MKKIEIDYELIGKNVKALREGAGYTQEKLSELVDITSSYVGQIERNERKISIDKLYKIAKTFNVSIDSLVGIEQMSTKHELMIKELLAVINKYKTNN